MAKSSKQPPGGDWEVGYGKPPKGSRWQKGQSGNPSGGKKAPLTVEQIIEKELNGTTQIKVGGQPKTVSKRHALAKKLVSDAFGGDWRARDLVLRLDALARSSPLQGGEEPLTAHERAELLAAIKDLESGHG